MKYIVQFILSAALCACATASPDKPRAREIYLTNANTVTLTSHIDMFSIDGTIAAVIGKRMTLPMDQELYVVIASGGGEPQSAYVLSQFLKSVPHTSLICKYCASAAGMIFANGNKRLAIRKSEMLMHEMYINHVTSKMVQNPDFIQSLRTASDEFNLLIYSKIGIPRELYEKKILNSEWIVHGQELVKLHLADEIVKIECDQFEYSLLPDTCS